MANDWIVGRQIRFYSAWFGIPILLSLLYPLTLQLQSRLKVYKQNIARNNEKSSRNISSRSGQSHTNQSSTSELSNDDSTIYSEDGENISRKDFAPFILLIYAFMNVIFGAIHLLFVAVFMSEPKMLGVTLNDGACPAIYWILYMAYNFSFVFFLMFMLDRIKIVFVEPVSLKLNSKIYTLFLVLIALNLLSKVIFIAQSTFFWSEQLHICTFIIDLNVLTAMYYLTYIYDSFLVFSLSFMFLRRLCQLTRQNPNVNKLIKRTIFFGLISCLTSLFISVGKLCGLSTEYFVNIDEILNCFCVVFSYKIVCNCNKWKYYGLSRNETNIDHSNGASSTTANNGSESNVYVQPPDEEVLDEIFSGRDPYEQDLNYLNYRNQIGQNENDNENDIQDANRDNLDNGDNRESL